METKTMKSILFYFFLLICSLGAQAQKNTNDWKPVGNRIKTPWAELVNPEKTLPEYPRPQLTRSEWQNLNGLWNYTITGITDIAINFDNQILVPFPLESSLSGVMKKLEKNQVLWYQRTFTIPESWNGKDILLHFGAVDHQATIYINGINVVSHTGGYTNFSANITPQLRTGKNILTVRVTDPTDDWHQPVGKQRNNPGGPGSIWYTSVTGIWQTVWMEPVEKKHITNIRTTPDLDGKRFIIDVSTQGTIHSIDKIEVSLSHKGRLVATSVAPTGTQLILDIKKPKLWTPDTPELYQMRVRLLSANGKEMDCVGSYTAMRKISMAQDTEGIWRLQLNNQNLFHFGPLDQGYWPDGLYTAPTDEALLFDVQKTKDWGFNMIRKHMKVEPARWYYFCDSLGLLVWQDMPAVCRSDEHWEPRNWSSQTHGTQPTTVVEEFKHEWKEIINQFYTFPCIVVWTPFNEAWGQFSTPEIVDYTRNIDPTRIINAASGGNHYLCGDILDLHDYARPPQLFLNDPTRPVVLGEYGGLGYHIPGHRWHEADATTYVNYKDSDELTDSYIEQGKAVMKSAQGITLPDGTRAGFAAAVYTQTTDVETEVNGLMTYDRKVMKLDEKRLTEINKAICNILSEKQ